MGARGEEEEREGGQEEGGGGAGEEERQEGKRQRLRHNIQAMHSTCLCVLDNGLYSIIYIFVTIELLKILASSKCKM